MYAKALPVSCLEWLRAGKAQNRLAFLRGRILVPNAPDLTPAVPLDTRADTGL